MLKKSIIYTLLFLFYTTIPAVADSYCGIGVKLFKDHTSNKTFIEEFLPNSPAAERKVPVGSEILSVDKKKTKYLYEDQIYNLLNGREGTRTTIKIKYNDKKYEYDIRRRCCYEKEIEDKVFDTYWKQIVPLNMAYVSPLPENIVNSASEKYKMEIIPLYEYWYLRRFNFQSGYNMCVNYYTKDADKCIKDLLKREINRTIQDEQTRINRLELQRQQARDKKNRK